MHGPMSRIAKHPPIHRLGPSAGANPVSRLPRQIRRRRPANGRRKPALSSDQTHAISIGSAASRPCQIRKGPRLSDVCARLMAPTTSNAKLVRSTYEVHPKPVHPALTQPQRNSPIVTSAHPPPAPPNSLCPRIASRSSRTTPPCATHGTRCAGILTGSIPQRADALVRPESFDMGVAVKPTN
jgi:hypothetical protein